jgi:hypothetical protein
MTETLKKSVRYGVVFAIALATIILPVPTHAQDQDDPPARVARLGYMQGSVSFQPAGETDWVGAVPNRPMSTGDQLWTDVDSRAEVTLGSAVIRMGPLTGFSFLNLDDHTVQIQLSSGMIDVRVRRLDGDDDFEIDTPNLAFTAIQPGRYRLIINGDGSTTTIGVRGGGAGEATGNGQAYTMQSEQVGYFSGDPDGSLYADVEPIGQPDEFDAWIEFRDQRYDHSRSVQYLSPDVVGYEDLDENGDWRDDAGYGHVWYPRVAVGWAPYHTGHWAWISPWGWTWVDDSPWGYAPFHYGRWVSVGGRWGWVAGPVAVRAVYAPALVVFIGGGPGAVGGNVGWFPLGPREVYVPTYPVSQAYMTRVNVSSTTVNVTQVTNVYNTTIINKTTITNVTYANRSVQGAVVVVPQQAFASAQPVAKASVTVNAQQIASMNVSARASVAPTHASVLGAHAASVGHVSAPPAAVASRQVVAKKTPPPPAIPFAKQQQALAAHPGQPLTRSEVQTVRPAASAAARPMVKQAPPSKPATPTVGHPTPANAARPGQPAPANAARPGQPPPAANQPANRPANPPAANERPVATPTPPNHAMAPPSAQPAAKPPANHPEPPPASRPQPQPEKPQPEVNRPPAEQPKPVQPAPHPATPPPAAKPAPPPQHPPAKPKTPEEKKKEAEEKKQ